MRASTTTSSRAAAGVELTHLASLYHDDVMDEASVRRGVASVNAAYDNSTAILVGDLLFGKASELVAGLGAEAVLIQAQTFVRLCSGQIRDDRPCPEGVDPVDYYLGVLADKTGVLIATAGRYGVMFSGGSPETVEIMRSYGEKVGVAFQLADDLIDIASDADDSGKIPGTDLREGVDTLAVLRFRATADPADAVGRASARAARRRPVRPTTPPWPRRSGSCGPTRRSRWRATRRMPSPARRRPCSTRCPTATPRRPCRPSRSRVVDRVG